MRHKTVAGAGDHRSVVLVCVQQNKGERQDEDCICCSEEARALPEELPTPALEDAVDLLRFPGQAEGLQILPQSCLEGQTCRFAA